MVAWIYFLTQIVDNPMKWNLDKISRLAYAAEVIEFDEPGGMMDHYSSAFGGLIYLEIKQTISITLTRPSLVRSAIDVSNSESGVPVNIHSTNKTISNTFNIPSILLE